MMQITENEKLVTITRRDLSAGQQAVQSTHAAIDFTFEYPNKASPWHKTSNYLVMVSVQNEEALKEFIKRCEYKLLDYTVFREPDINNEITAIAIEPCSETRKLVSKLPLLFKDKKNESV